LPEAGGIIFFFTETMSDCREQFAFVRGSVARHFSVYDKKENGNNRKSEEIKQKLKF